MVLRQGCGVGGVFGDEFEGAGRGDDLLGGGGGVEGQDVGEEARARVGGLQGEEGVGDVAGGVLVEGG